jgi:predicted enzyme related to lactoylglutathione lyase
MPKLKNPVGWFEIYVDELDRAQKFYEAVFKAKLIPLPSDGSFDALMFPGEMPGSGAMGALMKHPMRGPSLEGTLVYFSCNDCLTESNLVSENGGQIFRPKWCIGENGFIAIVGDTEGNAFGLHSFN